MGRWCHLLVDPYGCDAGTGTLWCQKTDKIRRVCSLQGRNTAAAATYWARGQPADFVKRRSEHNTLILGLVVLDDDGYYEGYYSLFDDSEHIAFRRHPGNYDLLEGIRGEDTIRRLQWFTKGFYAVRMVGSQIHIVDLRMGFEPAYVFSFLVGERRGDHTVAVASQRLDSGPDLMTVGWVWRRIWDETLETP